MFVSTCCFGAYHEDYRAVVFDRTLAILQPTRKKAPSEHMSVQGSAGCPRE